ncbi:hypothetical protein A1O1_05369 [Capronia coronata CBS 617.96]|uniref:Nonribosomal peptide synthetase sidC n=1 Tax=Capronia coronata CBS 617.96 TaxID=1182541 RepID=W9Z1Q6_9EURO|nr:uncharacterized protein A1O1_05369 [Capronia coronata CBS 617.96]EXJ88439.1 hypothetical protein A1O1_05369 [Capronia coronata CBS 617.96]
MASLANGRQAARDLSIVNQDRRTLPGPQLLHELVAVPDKDTLILDFLLADGERVELTYDRFHRLTDVLAGDISHALPSKQSGNHVVPVIIPQCPELYIAWVAVLKAGAAFCPVSHDVPPERLKFIVKDVEASFALTTSGTLRAVRQVLPEFKLMSLTLQDLHDRVVYLSDHGCIPSSLPDVHPSRPAYVMYTSGSTGMPKGVLVSHLSVTQSLLAHEEHIPPFRRFLQFASPTFDVSIFEIFFPFFRGVTLVGCDRERMLSDLPAIIRLLDADAAELTPTVAGTLLKSREAAPCLYTLLTIGEMLTPQVVSEFGGSKERPSMLYAMYGPTEAAIHCTVAPRLASDASVRSIGRPLQTATAFILEDSDHGKIAPIGESGELAIAGQLADGYLNRPDQNKLAFVDLPGHGPVYRTGDRARCRADGELEIMGRMTTGQVKLRGQRVELGEVEEVAAKTPGVQIAVANIIDDVLVLFCSAAQELRTHDVLNTCKSWLPPYMRPGEIVILPGAIPRLPSGKLDRKALERDFRNSRGSLRDDKFLDDTERNVARIVGDELGRRVDGSTSLWSLGMDSLRAIKVASRLRLDHDRISAAVVMDAENVAELSNWITNSMSAPESVHSGSNYEMSAEWVATESSIRTQPEFADLWTMWEKIVPCSSMQIAMLVETASNECLNFNDIQLQLAPEVSFDDFRRAFDLVAEQNEILRSGFVPTGQQGFPFAQVVWQHIPHGDLSVLRPLQLQTVDSQNDREVLIRLHHALYDGWSWDLVLDDLNAILCGKGIPHRAPFREYASYQNTLLDTDSANTMEYWRQLLADFVPSAFPTFCSTRPQSPSKDRLVVPLSMSYDQLSETAKALHCSRETILEAAWTVLMSSYVDSIDVAIGVVFAGRHVPFPDIESTIGPCLSTFPVRVDFDGLRTVRDLYSYIQRQRTRCLRNGNITLRDIHRAAALGAGKRIFDTLCVWQESNDSHNRNRSKVATGETHDALDYALVLEFEPRDGRIDLKLTFDTKHISDAHARLLAAQLDHITMEMLENVEMDLHHLWESSSKDILSLSNAQPEKFSKRFGLTTTISTLAKTDPARVAVDFIHAFDLDTGRIERSTLTYHDLFEKASTIASALQESFRIGVDDIVAFLAPKSVDLYIGILGAIISGAGYLYIDPRTPTERIRHITRESACRVILTAHESNVQLQDGSATFASIAELLQHHSIPTGRHWPDVRDDQLAYAVFTSGSTGVPKGVLITRNNLLSNIDDLSHLYPCSPEKDRLLQACSLAFDVSVFEIFWTWHMGMTLCSASNDVLFKDLERIINDLKITHLSMTPSVAALVHPDRVPHVKMLVTAGEPMNSRVFTDWADRGLFQGYGPSETTNICNVRPHVRKLDASNNVGPALPNTSIFVCRRQEISSTDRSDSRSAAPLTFKLVPKGGVGEIWIGGEQVGRGYIDAALTARSFLNHSEYGRLYRSGDIGRLLVDGSLMILGREDDQVKLRGQRIELGEINSSLINCEEVEDAVSVIIDEGKNARLVAFWTERQFERYQSSSKVTRALFQKLENLLPSYMVPDALVRLAQIPLTRQGKVDRRALGEAYHTLAQEDLQESSRNNASSDTADQLSQNETLVAQAISSVLGVPSEAIRRNSSFYALGLDSISAIHVAGSLRDHFPSVQVSMILQYPSIGQLVAALEARKGDRPKIQRRDNMDGLFDVKWKATVVATYARAGLLVDRFLPCTPLQEAMASSSLNSSSRGYQNTLRFEVYGDVYKLRDAWVHAMARHQLLRTGFVSTESADTPFAQVVLKRLELPWVDVGMHDISTPDLPFLMLPPWKLELSRRESNRYELRLEIHHCLYDAEAMSVLLTDIQSLYLGQEVQVPVPFDHYLSFMQSPQSDDTDEFWRERLVGLFPTRLTELVKVEDRTFMSKTAISERKATLSLSEFLKCVRRSSSTPLSLLQASWSRILSCIFDRQDVCFGNVFSGRNLPIDGVERIVAPCFNTLPLRVKLRFEQSNLDLSKDIQQVNLKMLPYQSSPLRRIQRHVSHDGKALFDTLLLFQQKELQLDKQIWTLLEESGDMPFPFILEISIHESADAITLKLHSQFANEGLLTRLLHCFDAALTHTTRFPQARALDHSPFIQMLPELKPKDETKVAAHSAPEVQTDGVEDASHELSGTERLVGDVLVQLKSDGSTGITKNTSIYRLGFDSIGAVQVAARLRKHGFNISRADILEAVTVEEIAAVCDSRNESTPSTQAFDLEAFDREYRRSICLTNKIDEERVQSIRPCTPTQSGILSQYLRSGCRMYFNRVELQLEDDVDYRKLKASWTTAQRLHEMLRTGFVETDDPRYPFAMVTYRANAVQLPWVDSVTKGDYTEAKPDYRGSQMRLPWHLHLSKGASPATLELSMLHALYDATSLDIMLKDVASIYRGIWPKEPVALSPIISGILALGNDEGSRRFWSELSADLCPTHFPDMRIYTRQDVRFHTASHRAKLSLAAAEKACALMGASLQAVCAGAWALLLSAYTAQDHVTFGIIMSGRDFDQEEQNMAAFPCINTVPFAIKVSQDLPELLGRSTRRCAGVMRHQHTPLSAIKRWAGVEGDLCDTVIVLQKYDTESGPKRPWSLTNDDATAEYAVSLEIIPTAHNHLDLQLTFQDSVIPQEQGRHILLAFDTLFTSILGFTSDVDSSRSVVPPKDKRLVTDVSYLHELVEVTARQKPQSTALEFVTSLDDANPMKRTWTYSELNSNGNRIAHLLLSKGAKVGELVAVCFDKCPEASFAILGVLKAGCGYVAIDPGAPKARKEFILRDSNCKIILTTTDKMLEFSSDADSALALDEGTWQQLPDDTPMLSKYLEARDTCYCLYTSGTTGTPKGCLISHDSAVQAMLSFQRIFQGRWNATSRWLQFASFHFDVSVLEQFWSWSVGICLTSAPRDLLFEDLAGFISALKITHLDLTPSLARLLTPKDVPSLCEGVFIVGGEQVRQDILDTWGDTHCLYNFYGPSEVTIGCTVHPQVPKNAKPTNIGQQWDNVGSFVLEPTSQKPVLRGAVGELCLSGPLVGKGYLNRPELTAEKFVTLAEYKTRVYRTGDLVRLLHDNSFDFLGRIDDQVKLRGQRLEIGEINHVALSAAPNLKDVVTMVIKHPTQQKDQLVTFFSTEQRAKNGKPSVVSSKETKELSRNIQQRCADRLPAYMVPTFFIGVSSIPLSVNNKVDHKALKAFFDWSAINPQQLTYGDVVQAETETPREVQEVIEVLSTYLQIPTSSVKPESRLFELGLDSVSAIGVARAFKRHGFNTSDVATILRHPVVRDLARALNQRTTSNHGQLVAAARDTINSFATTRLQAIMQSLGVVEKDIEHIAPCSPLQEGMISKVLRSEPDDVLYFTRFTFDTSSEVDLERLTKAWELTQQSVSILRTHFVPTADGVAQVVLRSGHKGVALVSPESEKKQSRAFTSSSFKAWVGSVRSLTKALPWKVKIFHSGERKYMVLDLFHGLYDGVSLPLLLDVVARYYDSPDEIVKVGLQFYETLPYGPLRPIPDGKDFWSSSLETLQPLRLPLDESGQGAATKHINLSQNMIIAGIQDICTQLDVTTSAYFQASFLYILQKMYKVRPMIGVVVSGRALNDINAEDVIGPMFNTIPFGIGHLKKDSAFVDLVRACHQFNVDVVPYQHTPLRKVAKYLGHATSTDLFDALFVFQKPRLELGQNHPWHEIPSQSPPDYPLNMEVEQQKDSFTVTLVAKTRYLDEENARLLLDMYCKIVQDGEMMQLKLAEDFCSGQPAPTDQEMHEDENTHSVNAMDGDSGDIKWTDTELAVRSQIAGLASMAEETIHLNRPTLFELGLDSIEAMKLSARLKNDGLKVPVSAIMRSPTVAGIARESKAAAERSTVANPDAEVSAHISDMQTTYRRILREQGIDLNDMEKILPVTPMQEGLLLESEKYLNTMVFELRPQIDVARLIEVWKRLSRQEPVLRTRFVPVETVELEAGFVQYVRKQNDVVQVFHDRTLTEMLQSMVEEAAGKDLRHQRTRVHILTDPSGKTFLVLAMPHALYDAWSMNLLHQQVAKLYHGSADNEGPSMAVPYEKHLQEIFNQAQSSTSKDFWDNLLSHIKSSLLKESLPPSQQSMPGFLLQTRSSRTLAETLKFCQQQGVTLQSLGLACWSVVLAHYLRRLDVCFGLVLSGRTTEGSDRLIFPTFNTVVFRPMIRDGSTIREALKKVHDASVRALEHQQYPLREALRAARVQGADAALFDTLFTFQKLPESEGDTTSLYDEIELAGTPTQPPYPVNIELEGQDNALVWTVAVQSGVTEKQAAEDLLQKLESVISSFMDAPEDPLLRKDNTEVSICGLPNIELTTQRPAVATTDGRTSPEEETNEEPEAWGPTEARIRDVLAEVSGLDKQRIKKTTGIFHLGLDSVSAIKVAGLLKKQDLRLPVSEMIKAQTVQRMAAIADNLKASSSRGVVPPTPKESHKIGHVYEAIKNRFAVPEHHVEDILPCTGGQAYMLDMWSASQGRLFYPTFWLRVTGTTVIALRTALDKVAEQIPLLRTTFVNLGDDGYEKTWQVVLRPGVARDYELPWSTRVEEHDDGILLTLRLHHALYDAVSFELIVSTIQTLCKDVAFPVQLNTSMHDFISRTNTDQEKIKGFWSSYLDSDHHFHSTLRAGFYGSSRFEKFNGRVLETAHLSEKIRHHGISLQSVFFAAYAHVYSALHQPPRSNAQDGDKPANGAVILGIYLANRSLDIEGLTELIAPTFNIVPLKVQVSAEMTLVDTALQIQRDLAEITKAEHCGVSMRDIHAWTGVKIDTFVNFLALPDNDSSDRSVEGIELPSEADNPNQQGPGTGDSSQQVKVTHAQLDPKDKSQLEHHVEAASPFLNGSKQQESTTEWRLPAIDIEAKVADGYLGIGVFAPQDMLDASQVDWIMEQMNSLLMSIPEA